MKCIKCNQNKANVFIRTNINGRIKEEYLCEECAKDINMKEFMSIDKMFANMFSKGKMFRVNSVDSFFDNIVCDFGDFNKTFDILQRVNTSEKQVENTIRIKEENKIEISKENDIKILQAKLQRAINEERYEDAAVLRDKINGKKNK